MKIKYLLSLLLTLGLLGSTAQANFFDFPFGNQEENDEGPFAPLGGFFETFCPPGEQGEWEPLEFDILDLLEGLNCEDRECLEGLGEGELKEILEIIGGILGDFENPPRHCPPPGHAIPEPSTYGLIGAGTLIGLVAFRRFNLKSIKK